MEIEAYSLVARRHSIALFVILTSLLLVENGLVCGALVSETIARAYHGDLSGVDRAAAYYDVLRLISRGEVSDDQVQEFIKNVRGFVAHRSTKNITVLRELSNLINGILVLRPAQLVPFLKDVQSWKDGLDADLRHFALAHGGVVKVSFPAVPNKTLAVRAGEDGPSADLLDDAGLAAFFKLAVRGATADTTTQHIVSGGTSFDLVPLYVDRSGVSCGLDDAYAIQIAGDVIAKKPETNLCGLQAGEPLQVMKREKAPAFTGEEVFVAHPGGGQWATVIEAVSDDVVAKLENDNLSQALNRIKMMPSSMEKLRWLFVLRSNVNGRVHDKNHVMLFKQLSAVFGLRNKFTKQELLEGRKLLLAYKRQQTLKEYDKYFSEWLKDITAALESYAVRFGDVVTIKSTSKNSRVLCVAPYVAPAGTSGYTQEMRLGIGESSGINKKHALVSLVSPVGKVGAVRIGDEVELSVCYAQGADMRCVVVQSGEKAGARVLAIRVEDADADSVFTVEHPLGSIKNEYSALVAGDAFLLRSKKTLQVLATSNELLGLWQPLEGKSDLQITKEHALSEFCIEPEGEDAVQQVVVQSFQEQLLKVRKCQVFMEKMAELLQLLDSLNPRISVQERNDFWDVLSVLVADKKHMNEHELARLSEILQKVVVVAKANNISSWVLKAQAALRDLDFQKKMKQALEQPGMDRFKALFELAPQVKDVSLQQSQVFLDELAALRKYKKDQSRAAKLLLIHASDEFGPDLKTTGSGNLLVP